MGRCTSTSPTQKDATAGVGYWSGHPQVVGPYGSIHQTSPFDQSKSCGFPCQEIGGATQ